MLDPAERAVLRIAQHPHEVSMRMNWVLFYNWANYSSERQSRLLKATQLERGRVRIRNRDAPNTH